MQECADWRTCQKLLGIQLMRGIRDLPALFWTPSGSIFAWAYSGNGSQFVKNGQFAVVFWVFGKRATWPRKLPASRKFVALFRISTGWELYGKRSQLSVNWARNSYSPFVFPLRMTAPICAGVAKNFPGVQKIGGIIEFSLRPEFPSAQYLPGEDPKWVEIK